MEVPKVQWTDLGGDFMTVLSHAILMRCGGQQTFTAKEISDVTKMYGGIRLAWEEKTQSLTLTLRSIEIDEVKKI